MTTQLVGIKEFRKNISRYSKKAQERKIRLIVLNRNVPMFEVKPVEEEEFVSKKLEAEIKKAREDIKKGRFYTQEQVMKEFGLIK